MRKAVDKAVIDFVQFKKEENYDFFVKGIAFLQDAFPV